MAFDIKWDEVGSRNYQSGIDRAVLYLTDGSVAPWNGIVSVEDNTSDELKSFYLDGIKILDHIVPGEFEGKLTAFTYPDEFDRVMGLLPSPAIYSVGLSYHEQGSKSFNLSYRTKVSNDINVDAGYKIHLLYNLRAIPDTHTSQTLGDQPAAEPFSWVLSATPPIGTIDGIRPTAHLSVDSRDTDPSILESLENILYGTETDGARFPTILEMRLMFGEVGGLYIIGNGDGTWTAIDPSNDYISVITSEEFQIDHADVTYLDADTYTITDTPAPLP